MAEVDACVGDGDDDARVTGREIPGFWRVDVLVVRAARLARVVQAPELVERRIVRCRRDRDHMVQLCVGHPRVARESLDDERLFIVLDLDEYGVDLAEALLRGHARVLEDRVLLGPRDACGEADDQLTLDGLRRLLRRGRDRSGADAEGDGGSQDEKREQAGHVPNRII